MCFDEFRFGRPALVLALGLLSGCAADPARSGPPSLLEAAVRVESRMATGSGALVARSPEAGGFVITTAHLVPVDQRVLVAVPEPGARSRWREAWVLKVDRDLDLALLWIRLPDDGPRWSVEWGTATEGPVTICMRAPGEPATALPARIVGPGRVVTDAVLSQGMSGAGVFHDRALVGVLYGLRVSPSPPEGRFVPGDVLQAFLTDRFGFLLEGWDPDPSR